MLKSVLRLGVLRSLSLRRKYAAYVVGILLGLSLLAISDAASTAVGFMVGQPIKEYEVIHEDVFCEKLRDNVRQCSRLNSNHLKYYFSLFIAIAWGASIRAVISTFELSIPYTVVLTITGLVIGMGSRVNVYFCETWSMYTRFARTPPEIILYVFLPVLLFESAFSMKSHIFMRSSLQILTVALPGMVITTFLTAIGCQQFMTAYGWTFNQAALFGAIVSATDPVAVVAILRESGTSETLSVMIEGESLLNDGVAILMYEIFKEIVENPDEDGDQTAEIAIKFVRITIGGPTFGYVMAKITILCLGSIFNDAATEITITLVSAYMTYFVGEFYLHVSGVMAVVILGVTISAESTAISPEVVHVVHQFWEMMSFLANTVLFVILGIVISETAINSFEQADGIYAIWLYFTLNIIRFLMLIMLSPLLSRVGYGIEWRNLIVMMWGGLRGAVGICLALEVFRNKKLCIYKKIGPKFLLQTAAVVILTLIINGSTTKSILDTLGITTLSIGKLQDMANAVKTISSSRLRSIAVMKHDRFLADSNWEIVHKFTHMKDPYAKKHKAHDEKTRRILEQKMKQKSANMLQHSALAPTINPENQNSNTLTNEETEPAHVSHRDIREDSDEFKALMEETRLRVLKAYKISFWRQYEKGTLSEQAVQILVSTVEEREDQILTMIHCSDLRHNWEITGFFVTLRNKIYSFMYDDSVPPKPRAKWRTRFHWLTTQTWFHGIIYFIIFLNVFPIAIETHINIRKSNWTPKQIEEAEKTMAFIDIVEIVFTAIYTLEFLLKWIGRGVKDYFSNTWNWIDFLVLFVSWVELILVPFGANNRQKGIATAGWIKNVRLIRFIRLLRWFKPLFPLLNRFLESRINDRLFLGYDIGRGYVQAMEDTLKFLHEMTPHEKVAGKFQAVLYSDRLQTVKELALLQQFHSGVFAAVKTRHASRAICNQMRDELSSLKEDGLLNEKEFELLIGKIEENMTRLWSLPSSFKESPPESLISHLSWVLGSDALKQYFTKFNPGDQIYYKGDQPNGLHMIVSGLVRLHYEPLPDDEIQKNLAKGQIPNTEMFLDSTFSTEEDDYLGCGLVCGELGALTNHPRASSIRCETDVALFHWPKPVVQNAIALFGGDYDYDYIAPRCLPTASRENYVPVEGDPLGYFRVLIVADYEALQSVRDSQNLSPIQMCIIRGPVMKDLGDILGEEALTKESRYSLQSRRSTLTHLPPGSVMIEGESLLNDGVAVLLYEIFVEIVEEPEMLAHVFPLTLHIFKKFCQIAIGGTIFGFIAGKITVLSLNRVYNDPTGEIAITVAAAYLTYFIGENLLGVSGIMAVVSLGLTLGSERTCISPESEKPVHHFWEMLGYLANTALFVMVGILISEVALIGVTRTDVWYLVGLYFQITLVRLVMLTLLSPLLSRCGYGMEWKDILVTAWGGLRGAVGLCLALEINENPNLCDKDKLGPKILLHTAGIVLMTLVINATTTKKLMDMLNMTQISLGRASDMENAFYLLMKTRKTAMSAFKSDRFLVGSVWEVVASSTEITNPYRDEIAKAIAEASKMFGKLICENMGLSVPPSGRHNKVMQDPRIHIMSYQEVNEEARRRIVHMLKSACWKQYQQGLINADAARALVQHCEKVEDTPLVLVSINELSKFWEPGFVLRTISELGVDSKYSVLQRVFQKISQYFIIERIHLAYEIATGFVSSIDTVIKLIPLLPDTQETLQKYKKNLEKERMLTFQELGPLQKMQPGVVQAVKTRITCRTVINHMREAVSDIKHEGLLDHEEAVVLELELEKMLKEMNGRIPLSLNVAPPISFIHQLSWLDTEDEDLKNFLVENANFVVFSYGDTIYSTGDIPSGIYVIVSGLVKVEYCPSPGILANFEQYGAFPNSEVLADLTFKTKASDIFTQGELIGEIGFLKNQPRAASATCGSYVTAYHFSNDVLKTAVSAFRECGESESKECLEAKIWRSWGLRVATALLQRVPPYFDWSLDKIKIHLESSVVPVINEFETFAIPDYVADIIVIEGCLQNYHTKEVYTAPCLIPRYCTHISWKRNIVTTNRFLMVAHEDSSRENLMEGEPYKTSRTKSGKSAITSLGSIDRFLQVVCRESKDLRRDARQRRRSIAISQVKPNLTTDFGTDESPSKNRLRRKPSFSLLRVVPNIVMASKGMKHRSVDEEN